MAELKKAPVGVTQKKINQDPIMFTYISKEGKVPASCIISPEDEVYMEWEEDGELKEGLRAIRYCKGEKSIFVDKQSDRARRTDVEFFHGALMVHPAEATLMQFMKLTNMNEANKETAVPGSQILFRENDQERRAKEEKEKDQKINQLKSLVYDMDFKESLGLGKVIWGSSFDAKEKDLDMVHLKFVSYINKDYKEFEKFVNSDLRKIKVVLLDAVDLGVISVDEERKCIYNEMGDRSVIFNAKPYVQDTLEEFANLSLVRDEYKSSFEEIQKSVKKGGINKVDPNAYLEDPEYLLFKEALSHKLIVNSFGVFANKDKRIGQLGKSEKEVVTTLRKYPKKSELLKQFLEAKKADTES